RALVEGVPTREKLTQLRRGIKLADGPITAPARVKLRKREGNLRSWLEITIHEGRKRQVKNMCAAIGHPVIKLRRIKFALLNAQGLKVGRCRRLAGSEIDQLYRLVGLKCE
ncbi:MAG TPA: pseudouridine synthase, partial [Firmicutes bacterium]|nr:pseudouridine synthase [Bacillota bacterium]